jgi:RNA polymerase-binding transcription factor DksA
VSEWSQNPIASVNPSPVPLDLNGIEADLAAVEVALERLDSGSYWTDEVTGADIPDAMLEADPTARRATDR